MLQWQVVVRDKYDVKCKKIIRNLNIQYNTYDVLLYDDQLLSSSG